MQLLSEGVIKEGNKVKGGSRMKKFIFSIILVIVMIPIMAIGGNYVALVDNTLVTDTALLRCLQRGDTTKVLIVTGVGGSVNIPFAIYEDGINTKTITLSTASSEKYTAMQPMSSLKVDWTDTAGTGSASLGCY